MTRKDKRPREYFHQYWNKKLPKYCKVCGVQLFDRTNRKVHCSNKCLAVSRKKNSMKFYDRIASEFCAMKEEIGCQICGYARYGGSLDWHHLHGKGRRVTRKMWHANTETTRLEMERCVLLCRNCHMEVHIFERLAKRSKE